MLLFPYTHPLTNLLLMYRLYPVPGTLVRNPDAESIHTGIPALKLGAAVHMHMIEEKGQIAQRAQLAKSSPASMMFSSKQRVPHHDIDSMSNQHTTQSNNREKYKYTHVCASRF